MLNEKIFNDQSLEYKDMVKSSFNTLVDFSDEGNIVLKVDNLEEASSNVQYIFRAEEAIQIASIISQRENKNVFLINEAFNDDLKNLNTSLMDNFYKLYTGLTKVMPRIKHTMNLILLNMQCPREHHENELTQALYLNSPETNNDIAILRNLGGINLFIPADSNEASYLLSVVEKNFYKEGRSNYSYFKLSSTPSPIIFADNYFKKEEHLKEWTGVPEIVYFSKNLEASFEVAIIASGPILYNALKAAKELEDLHYKVTVLNMSLLVSSNEYINEKIISFINNFSDNHKNILTIEEHSKVGGLGSLIAEIISENKNGLTKRVERMGIEDDLSPRNIISKAQEIIRF